MTPEITEKIQLENFIVENWDRVNAYIDESMNHLPVSFYNSVDIRESRSKVAPVDNNIYPAGFNNLCGLDLDSAARVIRQTLDSFSLVTKKIAIIPESHTKNLFYLDHLAILGKTVRDAGYEVIFGTFDESLFSTQDYIDLISHSKFDIRLEKLLLKNGLITTSSGENVSLGVLNNDQSNPLPVPWQEIRTPITPSPMVGWFRRQKSEHFQFYKDVADGFCREFSIDPDLIQARFKNISQVNFAERTGLEPLARAIDELKKDLPEETPIFVKASQGTYGMGISVVRSGNEILNMNKKIRNKMDIGKNQLKFTTVLVQEGIETIIKYDNAPAEVTIYLINGKSVGGFMRANTQKGVDANLNSRGMVFKKFCISEIRQHHDHKSKEALYTIIARLSAMASAMEIQKISNEESIS